MTQNNYDFHATTPYSFIPLTGVTDFKHEHHPNREELFGVPYINGNNSMGRIYLEDTSVQIK